MRTEASTVRYLGIIFNNRSYEEAADEIAELSVAENFNFVVTPNVDHAVKLHDDKDPLVSGLFRDAYRAARLRVCDSRVLQLLARLQGARLQVTTGSDLIAFLFTEGRLNGKTAALIGGQEETLALLKEQYPQVTIRQHMPPMGVLHSEGALRKIVEYVAESRCDYVFFAIGSPQSEIAAYQCYADQGARGVGLCVGAAIEFLVGQKVRAPRWVQAIRMEWAFRLLSEPRRLWKRYFLGALKIATLIFKQRNFSDNSLPD